MKYISQINAFYDALEINPLPAPSIALWHALHAIANKTGWQQEFSVSVSSLGLRAGLNEAAVKRARNKLKEAGFIEWRSRAGNQSATYRLTKLYSETSEFVVQNQGQNALQSVPQTVPQCVPQVVPQSVPINRHRLRLDKEDTPMPPKGERVNYQGVVELFNETCPSLPKVRDLTDQRRRAIKARIMEGNTAEDFRAVFAKVQASSFLTGKNGGWKCGFDWILKPANWQKIKEGNYDDGIRQNPNPALNYAQRSREDASCLDSLVQY